MIKPRATLLLVTALALGGCELTGSTGGPGEGLGSSLTGAFSSAPPGAGSRARDAAAAAVTNAALGGLIGSKVGAALDSDDRRLAYDAQIAALETGAPGAPVPWRNPASGHYGNIVAGPLYDQKGAKCRGYSHTITVNGELKTARGTACRGTDGSWAVVG